MNSLQDGIIVCGYRFSDMMYEELYEYLPTGFQMLLIASASNVLDKEVENLVCLSLPIKVHDLLRTIEMMEYSGIRARRKRKNQPKARSEEERQVLEQAKGILMERNGLSEEEAHRYMQKRSMDNGTGLVETAEMIVSLMGGG
jgi:response regulator NasT